MSEPTTEAGRALLTEYQTWFTKQGWSAAGWDPYLSRMALASDVLAIEAEAHAAGRAEALGEDVLAEAIHRSNEHPHLPGCLDMDRETARLLAVDVLAALTTETTERTDTAEDWLHD